VKKVVLLAVCLIGAGFGYRYFVAGGGDAAEVRYKAFAEEILHRRYSAAAGMADGLTAADLEKLGTQEQVGAGPAMFQQLFQSRFDINSRTDAPDGSVVLHATQLIRFNPVGVESAVRPAMFATLRQVVTLRKKDGDWKVTAFENVFEKMDSTPSR
jgi:hypothetical protein